MHPTTAIRITKRELLKIIAEQVAKELPEHPENVEAVEDSWAGGDNLELDVDYSKVSAGEANIASPEVLDLVVAEVHRRIAEKRAHSIGSDTERYSEAKDQNNDGKNDFEDVKIARMKASGMTKAEIEEEDPELFESTLKTHAAKRLAAIIKKTVGET
mgnify:CR=1 FL=1